MVTEGDRETLESRWPNWTRGGENTSAETRGEVEALQGDPCLFLHQAELSQGDRKVLWYLTSHLELCLPEQVGIFGITVITSPSLGSPFSTWAGWRN